MKKKRIESELNFMALLKNPIRLFGLVYIYFFVILLVIGVYFTHSIDTTSFNTVPGTALDTLNIVREIETKVGGIKPAMDLTLVTNPSADFVAIGKTKYVAACGSCHGNEGKGDGVAAVALNPKPRNFHSADGWTNGRTFYDLYKSVSEGVPGTGMIAYEFLSPEDRVAIIQYIRTMDNYPEATVADNNKLDATYKLSAGIIDPYNIPIKKSIEKNVNEDEVRVSKLSVKISSLSSSSIVGKEILEGVSNNPQKVISIFSNKLSQLGDINGFIEAVSLSPITLGFNSNVISLTENDWNKLYSYIKLFSNKEES